MSIMAVNNLWQDITERLDILDAATREIRHRGREYAEAEAAYRQALAIKLLELRGLGIPVTICPDLARGDEEVAALKVARDCAEASYKSVMEGIQVNKLRLKILEAQYDREWRG